MHSAADVQIVQKGRNPVDNAVAPVKQSVVSMVHQSDAALAVWARSFRKRFGDKLTLKRRTAYDDQCQGMVSGWRTHHENGDGV
jgi:hypothetical protein